MAVFSGPEIPNNGLVFHFDIGNTIRSWNGAPTTNRCANGEGVYTSGLVPGFWGREQAFGGIEPSGQASGIDTYGYGYFQFSISGTTTLVNRLLISPVMYYNSEAAVTAGTTYTFSYNIDNVSNYGYGIQATYLWYDSSNTFLSVTNGTYHPTISGWSRKTDTVTAPVNAAKVTTRFDFNGYSTIGTVLNFTLRIGGIQWEASAFQTPYVKTTNGIASRSNTQSISDLTKNTTITANSLTYQSDGTFKLNGTSDVLSTSPSVTLTSSYAIEAWIKRDAINAQHGIMSDLQYSWWLFYINSGNKLVLQHARNSPSYVINSVAGTANIGTGWTHVVGVFDATAGIQLYVNGVLDGSNSNTAVFDLGAGRGPQFVGVMRVDAGGVNSSYFNGSIDTVKIYNRALSASEVQQNFEAVRGRYGI